MVDANVWVSGALSQAGGPARIVEAFLQDRFTLVTSEPLLAEVAEVLARPHLVQRSRLTPAEIEELIQAMRVLGEVVAVTGEVTICRDPDDDAVIETARNGRADMLVSGDRDLIADPAVVDFLRASSVRVVTVTEFVQELEPSNG